MMIHYAWIIAFTGTLVLMLTQGFGRMSYSVILPSMKDGLVLTYTQVGLIGTISVEYLSLAVVGGFLQSFRHAEDDLRLSWPWGSAFFSQDSPVHLPLPFW
jgi:hypothetical protein